MAKKIISYKITHEGTTPDYVEDGGYLPYHPNSLPNAIFLGVSKDGADISEAEAEFVDEESLVEYVNTYMSGLVVTNPLTKEEKIFVVENAVAELFKKLGEEING